MFHLKICADCGQSFIIQQANYAYMIKRAGNIKLYYCSYKCYKKNGGDGGVQAVRYRG